MSVKKDTVVLMDCGFEDCGFEHTENLDLGFYISVVNSSRRNILKEGWDSVSQN